MARRFRRAPVLGVTSAAHGSDCRELGELEQVLMKGRGRWVSLPGVVREGATADFSGEPGQAARSGARLERSALGVPQDAPSVQWVPAGRPCAGCRPAFARDKR